MNAMETAAAWSWRPPGPRKRWKGTRLGPALFEAGRRPGLPAPVANAHARFECEARMAMREWLMS